MSDRTFPVLWQCSSREADALHAAGCPRAVPWDFVAPHEAQGRRNHSQTLERLSQRGGLSPAELVAVVTGQPLRTVLGVANIDRVPLLLELLAEGGSSLDSPGERARVLREDGGDRG